MDTIEHHINLIRRKLLYGELTSVFSALSNIRYAIVKGEPLSVMAYDSPFARDSADIDILTDRKNIHIVENSLKEAGFVGSYGNRMSNDRHNRVFCLSSSHQLLPYVKRKNGFILNVDINFDLFWGEYEGDRINVEEFLTNADYMEIYGNKIKSLPPLEAFIQLALHHYKDANSLYLLATRKSIRFDKLRDLYYLLKKNQKQIAVENLYKKGSEYCILPFLYYELFYLKQLFADDSLTKYVEALYTKDGERLLNCYGLCEKERKKWRSDFQTRLTADSLWDEIKGDLNEQEKNKILQNQKVFLLTMGN